MEEASELAQFRLCQSIRCSLRACLTASSNNLLRRFPYGAAITDQRHSRSDAGSQSQESPKPAGQRDRPASEVRIIEGEVFDVNAEGRLKKRIEHKLLQAGFDQALATDELKNQILELFRAYANASEENKAAVYASGQQRIMEVIDASRTSSSNRSSG